MVRWRVGVERAQARDLVVEQVDPIRARRTHRKHVDERTAHRELAALRHRLDAAIARLLEMPAVTVRVETRADRQHQTVRGEERTAAATVAAACGSARRARRVGVSAIGAACAGGRTRCPGAVRRRRRRASPSPATSRRRVSRSRRTRVRGTTDTPPRDWLRPRARDRRDAVPRVRWPDSPRHRRDRSSRCDRRIAAGSGGASGFAMRRSRSEGRGILLHGPCRARAFWPLSRARL